MDQVSRREALKLGLALGASAVAAGAWGAQGVSAARPGLRVGVIGAGGRGTGAVIDALTASEHSRLVAMADVFADRLAGSRRQLSESGALAERATVADERCFTGFDAYQKLLALDDVDMVILATPPGFRPLHFEAAVAAGKHVFMEKPAAVDPAGIRRVLAAGELAEQKRLTVVAGTQRRHQFNYLELMKRVRDGEIGEIVAAQCYWNMGGLWVHERRPEYTDMEWQVRNWLYFCWLSGDHICEQHVHNIDVVNWAKGAHPVKASGMGGRQVRTAERYGHIFDHFAVEFEYPDGTVLSSYCRQTDGCDSRVEEVLIGQNGRTITRHGFSVITQRGGGTRWRYQGPQDSPYMLEHRNLVASVTGEGAYLNETRSVAESTLCAIMGRMSAYTGKSVTWEQAMGSTLDLSPAAYEFGPLPTHEVPVPGVTPLV